MNKNIIIGVIVTALIVTLGYSAFRNNQTDTLGQNATTTDSAPGTNNTNPPSPSTPTLVKIPSAPGVQTDTSVTVSNSTAFVSGTVASNGAPTTYWYEYGPTTAVTNRTAKQNIGSGYNEITSPAYITGLRANTQYYFRLNAENSLGATQSTVYGFTTNNTAPVPGIAPTVQTNNATNIERTSVNLTGKVDANGNLTSWWFEFGESTALGSITNFGSVSGDSSTSVTASVSGLKPLTKYYYRINGQNQFGTVNGSVASFTTDGPAATSSSKPSVKTNTATNIGTSTVTLNGNLGSNGADTVYWFEYSKDSLIGSIVGTVTPEQTMGADEASIGVKADITGLSRNTKYYYRMIARNQYGTVEGSVVSFRTNR